MFVITIMTSIWPELPLRVQVQFQACVQQLMDGVSSEWILWLANYFILFYIYYFSFIHSFNVISDQQ